jgi:hypothetical protein
LAVRDAFVGEVGGVEEVGALDAKAEVTAECGGVYLSVVPVVRGLTAKAFRRRASIGFITMMGVAVVSQLNRGGASAIAQKPFVHSDRFLPIRPKELLTLPSLTM